MRSTLTVRQMMPEKALVRLLDRDEILSSSPLEVVRTRYEPNRDWELALVERLGEGDWDPVSEGDHVLVRAGSGGKAGADVSRMFDERRETLVIVDREEIVVRVDVNVG